MATPEGRLHGPDRSKEQLQKGEYIDWRIGYMEPDMPDPLHTAAAWAEENIDKIGPIDESGLLLYRQAVAGDYERRYGLQFDPETQIFIAPGTTAVLTTVFSVFNNKPKDADDIRNNRSNDPNNQLWEPDQGYVYRQLAENVGLWNVSPYPLRNGIPDADVIHDRLVDDRRHNNQGAILIAFNFPVNPTGRVASAEELEKIAGAVRASGRENVYLVEDNVYCRMVYRGQHASAAPYYSDTIIADAPSKRGANLQNGFGIAPPRLAKEMIRRRDQMAGVSVPRQFAGALFMSGEYDDYIEEKRADMIENREAMKELRSIEGIEFDDPDGGPYIYFSQNLAPSNMYVAWAKHKCGVLLNDGIKYESSKSPNECFSARASFAVGSPDIISEGVRRLRRGHKVFDPREAQYMLQQELAAA